MVLILIVWLISIYLFYFVIKKAVKNGIIEAHEEIKDKKFFS